MHHTKKVTLLYGPLQSSSLSSLLLSSSLTTLPSPSLPSSSSSSLLSSSLTTLPSSPSPSLPHALILFHQGLSNRPLWTGGATILECTCEVRTELMRGSMLAEIDYHLKEDINYSSSSSHSSSLSSSSLSSRSSSSSSFTSLPSSSPLCLLSKTQTDNRTTGQRTFMNRKKLTSSPQLFDGWNDESCGRLRALLERVLSLHSSYSLFWILYVHLECFSLRYLEGKKVFFRAINAVGFCKNVWVLLFGPLRPAFSETEIKNLKNVMIEEKNLLWRFS